MKNKSVGFYGSSLEMLLDTMCAMLGGVVFIALMVAMFAQDSTTRTPEQYHQQAAQLSNDLASVVASNTVVESELLASLQRLQDPHLRPQTNMMRLPNLEKSTTKEEWKVIMQYGKIYPLYIFAPGRHGGTITNLNKRTLQFQSGLIKARPELGDEPENGVTQMVRAFKANAKTNYYFAFVVYEDSFDAFVRARETVAKLGFQYGWEPWLENQALGYGSGGQVMVIHPQ